ncbi:MAG TPA: 30S ribosomal protein S17 [Candidatus Paceibacterota bacterium]
MQNKTVKNKTLEGIVVSDKMKDTIVVRVGRFIKNPKYHKYVTSHKRYKVHDAGNTKKIGDKVTIVSCRPMSKDKSFKILS